MKTILKSTVPTVYQYGSIRAFGIPVEKLPSGAFTCRQEFNTKKEAVEYMLDRAEVLSDGDEKELRIMKRDIKSGCLRYDATTLTLYSKSEE